MVYWGTSTAMHSTYNDNIALFPFVFSLQNFHLVTNFEQPVIRRNDFALMKCFSIPADGTSRQDFLLFFRMVR